MNVHRLLALSTTAVVVAACSGGGGGVTSAPRPAPSATGVAPAFTTHAPNGTLTLKFSPDYVRFKNLRTPKGVARKLAAKLKAKTSAAKRHPAFVDPAPGNDIQVEVTNTGNNGVVTSYMAAIDVPVTSSQSNTQTIPIYLAPGTDQILVQETGYEDVANYSGYLLAQGTTTAFDVGEGSANTVGLTMQLVMGGDVVTTDVSTFESGSYLGTSNNFSTGDGGQYASLCISNGQSVYFLPVDSYSGTYVFANNPGDVSPSDGGIPAPYSVQNVSPSGSSSFAPNPFGGYTINFDSNNSPLVVELSYDAAVSYGTDFGPFAFSQGALTAAVPASYTSYYANLESYDSPGCAD